MSTLFEYLTNAALLVNERGIVKLRLSLYSASRPQSWVLPGINPDPVTLKGMEV